MSERPEKPETSREKFLRTFAETYERISDVGQPVGDIGESMLEAAAEEVGLAKVNDPERYLTAVRCVNAADLPSAVHEVALQLALRMLDDPNFQGPAKEAMVTTALKSGLRIANMEDVAVTQRDLTRAFEEAERGPVINPIRVSEHPEWADEGNVPADQVLGKTRYRQVEGSDGRPAFEFSPNEGDIDFEDWRESVETLASSTISRRPLDEGRPVYRVEGPLAKRLLAEASENTPTIGGLSTTLRAGNDATVVGPSIGRHFAEPQRRAAFKPPTRWAGSPAWERVWREALEGWKYEIRNDRWNAYGFTGALTAGAFEEAHALAILPEQASVLPKFTVDEVVDQALTTRLPFDPVFIDFTDEDGNSLAFDVTDQLPPRAREAILTQVPSERRGNLKDRITAHAAGVMLWKEAGGFNVRQTIDEPAPLCASVWSVLNDGRIECQGMWITSPEQAIGYVRYDKTQMPECQPLVSHSVAMYGDTGEENLERQGRDQHAVIIPALRQDEREEELGAFSAHMEAFKGVMTAAAVERALASVYLTQSANVELGQVTLHKRDRKRAEKRNWPIAETVYVRVPRRRTQRASESNGDARNYTHRFDRIGHYKHVQRGPHVRCRVCLNKDEKRPACERCKGTGLDPALVKPCTRRDETTGKLTCPNGCRREWHPPSVVGPEDKPYVPKARRVLGS